MQVYAGSQPEVLDMVRKTGLLPNKRYYNWIVLYLETGEILCGRFSSSSLEGIVLKERTIALDSIKKLSIRGGRRSAKKICSFWKHLSKRGKENQARATRLRHRKVPVQPKELPVVRFIRRKGEILNKKTEMVPTRELKY